MGADQFHRWNEIAASALDWWHDAGVDVMVEDEPRDWFAAPTRIVAAPPPANDAAALTTDLPTDYAGFWDWRMGDGAPERGWGVPLIAPEGPRDADLLVMVDHANGEVMLGDAEGAMFDRILSAIGRTRDDICLTALAQARPLADTLPPEAMPTLIERAQLLMRLTPARVLLIVGHTTGRALLAPDGVPVPRALHAVNCDGRELPVLAIAHPRFMLKHPQVKRDAWRCLQSLLGGIVR